MLRPVSRSLTSVFIRAAPPRRRMLTQYAAPSKEMQVCQALRSHQGMLTEHDVWAF